MNPLVLVHGAFHGGWCWRRVADILRAAGHAVFTPTLTGLGERAHLLRASTSLETHIADVCGVLEAEELEQVILVGHSYGGIPVMAAADRLPQRIAAVVYLDAVLLRDGQAWSDVHSPKAAERLIASAQAHGGIAIPAPEPAAFGIADPHDRQWAARRLAPHPLGTYRQALRLRNPGAPGPRRVYIDCTLNPLASLAASKATAASEPGWTCVKLPAHHDAMITAPQALADALLQLCSPAAANDEGGIPHVRTPR